jgi:hypothetical protein
MYLKDKINELEPGGSGNKTMWKTVCKGCYVQNSHDMHEVRYMKLEICENVDDKTTQNEVCLYATAWILM